MSSKCPRCSKSVYAAEEKIGAGKKWHKCCFTCKECNKSLDSTTLADAGGEIYCKGCHGRNFGPSGYGYGGGAGVLSTDKGKIGTVNASPQGPKAGGNSNPGSKGSSPAVAKKSGDGCPKCGKAVYMAEQILGPSGSKYHKACFLCTECNKRLDSTTMADRDGVIFCKSCYGKNFGPKGVGFGGGAGALINTQ